MHEKSWKWLNFSIKWSKTGVLTPQEPPGVPGEIPARGEIPGEGGSKFGQFWESRPPFCIATGGPQGGVRGDPRGGQDGRPF